MIQVKRVYEPASADDGKRFLVDRIWPRGMKKDSVEMIAWEKDAAPSTELRKWFNHDPVKWNEFKQRYHQELSRHPGGWQPILEAARNGDVTLLYSAKEKEYNQAVALKEYLESHLRGSPVE